MPSNQADGNIATTIGTPQILTTVTVAGNYQLKIDASNMTSSDEIFLYIEDRIRSGGTAKTAMIGAMVGVQSAPICISFPISVVNEAIFYIDHKSGTSITADWAVVNLAT